MKRLSLLAISVIFVLSGCGRTPGDQVFENITRANYDEATQTVVEQLEPQDKEKARLLIAGLLTLMEYEEFAYAALAGSDYELQSDEPIYARHDKIINGRTIDEVIEMGKLVYAEASEADYPRINRLDRREKKLIKLRESMVIDLSDVTTGFDHRKGTGHGTLKLGYTAKNFSSMNVRGFVMRLQFMRKDTGETVYQYDIPVSTAAGEFGPGQTIKKNYRINTRSSSLRLNFLDKYRVSDLRSYMEPIFASENASYKAEAASVADLSPEDHAFVVQYNFVAEIYGNPLIGGI